MSVVSSLMMRDRCSRCLESQCLVQCPDILNAKSDAICNSCRSSNKGECPNPTCKFRLRLPWKHKSDTINIFNRSGELIILEEED